MSQCNGDVSRRRRLAGGVRGEWYAYWRTVRQSLKVFGARVATRPFSHNTLVIQLGIEQSQSTNHKTE